MSQTKMIKLEEMTNKQCEQFISCLDTTGFTNYFDTRNKRVKLIYAFKYMNEVYIKFKEEVSSLSSRQQKQSLIKNFLDSVKIDIPSRTSGISEEEWSYIKTNWLEKLLEEKENDKMSKKKNNLVVLNKEEIKGKLEEISNKTTETITEVSKSREEIEREITVEPLPKPEKKVNKRSLWKTQLVHDLVTDQILPCDEYLKSKNAAVKKGNTWHIDNEVEVEFRGQKLNARWYKEENSSLQNEQQ